MLTLSGTVTKAASNAFGGAANQLTVAISDNGFLLPVGPGNLIQTVDTNSPAQTSTASGSLTASGFYSNTNTLFCQTSASCTGATPNASFSSYLVSNPGQTDTLPVPNFTAPFALDQVLTYNFTSQGSALVQSTLSAVGVPEPAAVFLFGSVLVVTAGLIRRRSVGKKI